MSKVPAGWEKAVLADICKKTISYGIVQTGPFIIDGVPCLRVVDLTQQYISLKEVITTSKEINDSYKKTVLEKDEIVMALRGVVGLVKLIGEDLIGANITRGLARISPRKDKVDPAFLLWALRSPILRSELLSRVAGSALQEISLGELRKVETLLPPLPEQTKIAQILSTWDKAIATTEKLIGNSQQQKKALMQSLLTGKKRLPGFEGEWQVRSLKNIVSIIYGKSPKDIFQEDGKYPVIGTGGITGRTNKYLTADKSVILGRKGTIDKPMLVNSPFWAIDTTFYCQPINNVDITWFYYWVSNINLRIYNEASGVPSISRENLYTIQVVFPSLPEQQKIAAVLTAADNEIELLQKKLVFLKQEKTALMQQLLTGKRRVKVEAA